MACLAHCCKNPSCGKIIFDNTPANYDCPVCGGPMIIHFDED